MLWDAIIMFLLVLAVSAGSHYFNKRKGMQRIEALKSKAAELGFEFSSSATPKFEHAYQHLRIFHRASSTVVKNQLSQEQAERQVYVFDLTCIYSGRDGDGEKTSTIMLINWPGASLPRFALRPDTPANVIATWFVGGDIDFKAYPRFSWEYYLQGENEEAVRELFTGKLLKLFSTNFGWVVEAEENVLLLCREGRIIEPEKMETFITSGLRIGKAFGA